MMFPNPTEAKPGANGVDLMIDIETMGTRPTAPIVSIGACLFDPRCQNSFEYLSKYSFVCLVDLDDATKHSPSGIESGTVKWWLGQSDAAIKRLVTGEMLNLKDALTQLWQFATDRGSKTPEAVRQLPVPKMIWAKSPDFDCKIIEHACRSAGVMYPFQYFNQRCVRTAVDLAFPDGEESRPAFTTGVHHDARDDAVNQAMMIQACYSALGLSGAKSSGVVLHTDAPLTRL